MPIDRRVMSVSQFAELVGIEPGEFVAVDVDKLKGTITLVTEGEGSNKVATANWIIAGCDYIPEKVRMQTESKRR